MFALSLHNPGTQKAFQNRLEASGWRANTGGSLKIFYSERSFVANDGSLFSTSIAEYLALEKKYRLSELTGEGRFAFSPAASNDWTHQDFIDLAAVFNNTSYSPSLIQEALGKVFGEHTTFLVLANVIGGGHWFLDELLDTFPKLEGLTIIGELPPSAALFSPMANNYVNEEDEEKMEVLKQSEVGLRSFFKQLYDEAVDLRHLHLFFDEDECLSAAELEDLLPLLEQLYSFTLTCFTEIGSHIVYGNKLTKKRRGPLDINKYTHNHGRLIELLTALDPTQATYISLGASFSSFWEALRFKDQLAVTSPDHAAVFYIFNGLRDQSAVVNNVIINRNGKGVQTRFNIETQRLIEKLLEEIFVFRREGDGGDKQEEPAVLSGSQTMNIKTTNLEDFPWVRFVSVTLFRALQKSVSPNGTFARIANAYIDHRAEFQNAVFNTLEKHLFDVWRIGLSKQPAGEVALEVGRFIVMIVGWLVRGELWRRPTLAPIARFATDGTWKEAFTVWAGMNGRGDAENSEEDDEDTEEEDESEEEVEETQEEVENDEIEAAVDDFNSQVLEPAVQVIVNVAGDEEELSFTGKRSYTHMQDVVSLASSTLLPEAKRTR